MTAEAEIVVVVHGLGHLRAALTAGAAGGRGVTVVSAEVASAFAGAGWFLELVAAGRAEYPGVRLTAILDCGDRAGDVLAALKLGATHIVFTGHPDALSRLRAIAAETGATILDTRPVAVDRAEVADLKYTLGAKSFQV